jgi:N-acetylated-alpha-linked acidic dipeptidase
MDQGPCRGLCQHWYVGLICNVRCALKPQILCSDTSASGSSLKAAGSPLLAHLLRETAEQLPHPYSEERSLWDARKDTGTLFGEHINAEIAAMHMDELLAVDSIGVSPLGSGSDYTVFLQYHGVSKYILK